MWSDNFQDNGHQTWKSRDLGRWETNAMSSRNTPACCPETVPRLHNTGRENTEGDCQNPWTEETELSPRSQDRVLGKEESCKEGAPWRVTEDQPQAFSQVLTSTCDPKPGRNHSKGLEVTVPGAHKGLGTVPVPTSQLGEAQDSWGSGWSTQ